MLQDRPPRTAIRYDPLFPMIRRGRLLIRSMVTVVVAVLLGNQSMAFGRGRQVTCEVNGTVFEYTFPPGSGKVNVIPPNVVYLNPGDSKIPFTTSNALFPSISLGHTAFGASIGRLVNPKLVVDQLPSEAKAGRTPKHLFYPREKPTGLEYRNVNGRRWLVTTKFEPPGKRIVESRVFLAVEDGFLITFNLTFYQGAPLDGSWRRSRLQVLDNFVAGFRMRRR